MRDRLAELDAAIDDVTTRVMTGDYEGSPVKLAVQIAELQNERSELVADQYPADDDAPLVVKWTSPTSVNYVESYNPGDRTMRPTDDPLAARRFMSRAAAHTVLSFIEWGSRYSVIPLADADPGWRKQENAVYEVEHVVFDSTDIQFRDGYNLADQHADTNIIVAALGVEPITVERKGKHDGRTPNRVVA